MLTRIYALIWLVVAFTAGVVFLTGNFTMLTTAVFGFIIIGLVFMGMIAVLPASIAHPAPVRYDVSVNEPQVAKPPIRIIDRARTFKADLVGSNGVEIRKPRFH